MSCISIVVALGRNRAIGRENKLLWKIPDDLKHFKELTLGHPVIMGRKTFESILGMLGKPLPGRTNIVVTRNSAWSHEGVLVASSVDEALALAATQPGSDEIHIGGGAEIYAQVFPKVDRLYLTLVEDEQEGDAFFPAYEAEFTKVLRDEAREHNGLHYRFLDLERN